MSQVVPQDATIIAPVEISIEASTGSLTTRTQAQIMIETDYGPLTTVTQTQQPGTSYTGLVNGIEISTSSFVVDGSTGVRVFSFQVYWTDSGSTDDSSHNSDGNVVTLTYTPGVGTISELHLRTTTLPNGSQSTIISYATADGSTSSQPSGPLETSTSSPTSGGDTPTLPPNPLSTGVQAGIGVGAGLAGIAIIAGLLFCIRRQKRRRGSPTRELQLQSVWMQGSGMQGQMQGEESPQMQREKDSAYRGSGHRIAVMDTHANRHELETR